MEKIAILTDSTSDLVGGLINKDNIYILPLYVNIDGSYLKDGIDIKTDEVIAYNEKNPDNPARSSAPSPGDVDDIIKKIYEDGYEKIIVISVSSALSASYSIFKIKEEDDENIRVIDSKTASLGEALLVKYGIDLIESSLSFEEVYEKLIKAVDNKAVYIWVNSLDSLRAGGRLSNAAIKAVKFFNMKPILNLEESGKVGVIKLRAKEDKAIEEIVKKIEKDLEGSDDYYFAIGHGGDESLLEKLEKRAQGLIENSKAYLKNNFGSVIRVHSGKKAFAVFYMRVK